MRKIVLVFAIVGLVSGIASAKTLEEIAKERISAEEKQKAPEKTLKEIFKEDYREELKLAQIMEEARAEVDAEFQEQTKHKTKSLEKTTVPVISFNLEMIIAAIMASAITVFGVTLANRANSKNLIRQLNHDAQQKDKERELQIRKEVYIEAAEAIAESIEDIQRLPNRIKTENFDICNTLLQAMAKVHMVGTLDTVKSAAQFTEKFNQSTLPIVPKIVKFVTLKQELVYLNNLGEIQINTMNEINRNFEQMDSSSKQDAGVLETYKNQFQEVKTKHDTTLALMSTKEDELKCLHIKLISMCLSAGIYLQKEALNVILSIRKELNLEIDSTEYLSQIEEMFKGFGGFNQEDIEKLIQG